MRLRTKFRLTVAAAAMAGVVYLGWGGGQLALGAVGIGGAAAAPPVPNASTAAEWAALILANPNITFRADDASAAAKAHDALVLTAAGQPVPVEHLGTTVHLSAKLLKVIYLVGQRYHIGIGYIANGGHSKRSYHYSGTAVDIDYLGANHVTGWSKADRQLAQYAVRLLPPGGELGQSSCMGHLDIPKGVEYVDDSCDHLHLATGPS